MGQCQLIQDDGASYCNDFVFLLPGCHLPVSLAVPPLVTRSPLNMLFHLMSMEVLFSQELVGDEPGGMNLEIRTMIFLHCICCKSASLLR